MYYSSRVIVAAGQGFFPSPTATYAQDANLTLLDDIQVQMTLHNLMQPHKSMLKFRLPWEDGSTDFLDGTTALFSRG